MSIDLPSRDPRVHVFAVTGDGGTIPHQTYLGGSVTDGEVLKDALGADGVDTTHAEVFAISDIAPMRLRDYIAQAHDVPASRMEGDALTLDGLRGDVVVLSPRALDGVTRLDPSPLLDHIGAYAQAEADDTPRELPPAAREPSLAEPDRPAEAGPKRTPLLWIAVGALVLAAIIVIAV